MKEKKEPLYYKTVLDQARATREDFIDEDTDAYHDEALEAVKSIGIPEDEAENFLEDMGL